MRRLGTMVALTAVVAISACKDDVVAPQKSPEESQSSVVQDSGWILIRGTPIRIVFEVHDGRAIWQGDIDVGRADKIAKTKEELLSMAPPLSPTGGVRTSGRWPGGRIPYVIQSGFIAPHRALDAMAQIRTNAGGVWFDPKNSWDNTWVEFQNSTDPSFCGKSSVGMQTGPFGDNTIKIRTDTIACPTRVVVHELLHALGFYHEQSRCDRDSYVQILLNNIQDGQSYNFDKVCSGEVDLESYDEGSIMHYGAYAYGKPDPAHPGYFLQTIRSLRGLDNLMGTATGVSNNDVFTMDDMYQPAGPVISSITNQNGHPFLQWAHSGRATYYGFALIRVYEEWDDYAGTYYSYEENTSVGTGSSGLSALDTQATFTGNNFCQLWSNINGSADYAYYYVGTASFANGVVSTQTRYPAPVAPDYPCQPDGY